MEYEGVEVMFQGCTGFKVVAAVIDQNKTEAYKVRLQGQVALTWSVFS